MAKNKITDLRNHLFAQLERLSDEQDMKNPIKRDAEIAKARAITGVSAAIVQTVKVEIDFLKAIATSGKNGIDSSFIVKEDPHKSIGAAPSPPQGK